MISSVEFFFALSHHFGQSDDFLIGAYNLPIVIISILIAIAGSFVAFLISDRNIRHRQRGARVAWIALGSITLGVSVWTMHFIGMLAFRLPVEIRYDPLITALSIIPAVLASAIVLHTVSREYLSWTRQVVAGVLLGAGIGIMHYSGMMAMQLNARMLHDPSIFALSIVVAVSLSTLALGIQNKFKSSGVNERNFKCMLGAAAAMGSAISLMHYTAMTAAIFVPGGNPHAPLQGIAPNFLEYATVGGSLLIMIFMATASAIDKYILMTVSLSGEVEERLKAEQALQHTLEGLEDIIDERTRDLTHEIAERTQAEDSLRYSEERTRLIVNSVVDGFITINKIGKIIGFNPGAEKMFGYSVMEVTGKHFSMFMPEPHAETMKTNLTRYVETGEPRIVGISTEMVGLKKDGSIFPLDFVISEIRNGQELMFTAIIRDITERKEAEDALNQTLKELRTTQDALVQTEKMASLGGLVAGVAHEINTPIGVGVTAISHLKEQADGISQSFVSGTMKKRDLEAFLDVAVQSTGIVSSNLARASDLIRSFKQVAVDQSSEEARSFNFLEYVEEVLTSLRPELRRSNHEMLIEGDREIEITSFPGALSQIITNLVMNSVIHAYGEGEKGKIHISTTQNNTAVHLAYSDDGKGMDKETVARIFDPFFTTKRGQGGSGLGMHILYNQVTRTLGGNVVCHSEPGKGTTFEISIPLELGATA